MQDASADPLNADVPLTVAAFMQWANRIYYSHQDPLGRAGDFITAPEISQLFGEMLGAWLAAQWLADGSPAPCILLEPGPGRGTLMADVLRATRHLPGFHAAIRLHLLEISPALQALQAHALEDFDPVWHTDLASVPTGQPLYLVANEFFDALPVRQCVRTVDGWLERHVMQNASGSWQFVLLPPALPVPLWPDSLPVGAVWEHSPVSLAIMADIAGRIARHGGAVVIVDYGYGGGDDQDPVAGDTLQAVRHHAPCAVLSPPGTADLSAHVDFAALAHVARAAGCSAQITPQGAFLRLCGIEARLGQLLQAAGEGIARREALAAGYRRLVAADAMGMLFKVLTIVGKAANRS
jgi:NADH dehydrogenase [ubiquinone] 1 alpha subcomplex assembly factor 7